MEYEDQTGYNYICIKQAARGIMTFSFFINTDTFTGI